MNQIERNETLLKNDPSLISAAKNLEETKNSHQELTQRLSEHESRINEKRIKLEQSESSLYKGNISNPKELQDIQKEVSILKNQLMTLEETQLDLMFQLEKSQELVENAKRNFETTRKMNESKNTELQANQNKLGVEQSKLKDEKQVVTAQLPQSLLSVYEKLYSTKKGLVVSKVEEGCCEFCGASLTPSEIQQAKSPLNVTYCSACGRILYAD
jgi:predicted  nucleic acid-binding Zn-ribbon protein